MSASLRDRRVRIYGYTDAGGAGFMSSKYTFRTERWALVHQRTAVESTRGSVAGESINAEFDFDPAVEVHEDDLLVDGDDHYYARGITIQRTPPAKLVTAERVTDDVFQGLELEEGDEWGDEGAIDDADLEDSVVES